MRQTILIPRKDSRLAKQEVTCLLNDPDFQTDLKRIKKEINTGKDEDYVCGEIANIIDKYNLHLAWFDFLFNLVIYNKKDNKFDPEAIRLEYGPDEYTEIFLEETIAIHITPETRIDDLENAYKKAQKLFNVPSRKKSKIWSYHKRDYDIYKLKQRGFSDDEIAQKFKMDMGNVKTIISSFKKKIKKLFKNKQIIR